MSVDWPVIYDPLLDAMRPITQADVDQLIRVASAWTGLQMFVKQKHNEMVAAAPTSSNLGHG